MTLINLLIFMLCFFILAHLHTTFCAVHPTALKSSEGMCIEMSLSLRSKHAKEMYECLQGIKHGFRGKGLMHSTGCSKALQQQPKPLGRSV